MLDWQLYRNLENSLKDFLDDEVSSDNVTDYDNNLITIRVGRKLDNDWTLPCISIYLDGETSQRLQLGSNQRIKQYLLILDIFAQDEGQRLDLAYWLSDKLENGFRYYSYTVNPANPEQPIKTSHGLVNIDAFVTNTRVNLGDTVSDFDAHRHRISIRVWISGDC